MKKLRKTNVIISRLDFAILFQTDKTLSRQILETCYKNKMEGALGDIAGQQHSTADTQNDFLDSENK